MEIVTLDEINVVGMKVKADWQGLHAQMPEAWKKFSVRLHEIQNRKSDIMVDVSLDITDGIYTQLVGVEAVASENIPEEMELVAIPQQQYLTYRHKGNQQDIAASFGKMYEWAKSQKIEMTDFKIDRGYTLSGNEREHELFIKVASGV